MKKLKDYIFDIYQSYMFRLCCIPGSLRLVLILVCFSVFSDINAQRNRRLHSCGSEYVNRELEKNNAEYRKNKEKFEKLWQDIQNQDVQRTVVVEDGITVYEIPVVVHIIHTGNPAGGQYNRSDAEITAWIDRANAVFDTSASDVVGEGSGGTVIPVRLVLAKRKEDCTATNGIVRVNGSTAFGNLYTESGLKYGANGTGVEESVIRNQTRWNPLLYYNMYIVNKINGNDLSSGSGIAGYAYTPFSPAVDGTFMVSQIVHPNDFTLAHELGHALSLLHPFQGGSNNTCPSNTNCSTENDKVCDTKPTLSLLGSCPDNTQTNPCTGSNYEGEQHNIMGYSYCSNRFTLGQRNRVLASIEQFRESLINSKGGLAPGTESQATSACTINASQNPSNQYNMGPCNVSMGNLVYKSRGFNIDGAFYIDHTVNYCRLPINDTKLIKGHTYGLEISVETNNQKVIAYIDYNNNGSFESSEKVYDKIVPKNTSHMEQVTIPTSAVVTNVPLRMRVIADWQSVNVTPCGNPLYGQVEDFQVTIVDQHTSSSTPYNAGVGINTASPQAVLDVQSSTDGALFPRMSQTAIDAIPQPIPDGMMVYNLDKHCVYIYTLGSDAGWKCIKMSENPFK